MQAIFRRNSRFLASPFLVILSQVVSPKFKFTLSPFSLSLPVLPSPQRVHTITF
jgi:hypothetical protein